MFRTQSLPLRFEHLAVQLLRVGEALFFCRSVARLPMAANVPDAAVQALAGRTQSILFTFFPHRHNAPRAAESARLNISLNTDGWSEPSSCDPFRAPLELPSLLPGICLMSESIGQKRQRRRHQLVLRPLSPGHFERLTIQFFRFVVSRFKPKNPGQLHHGIHGVMMLGAKNLAASLHGLRNNFSASG